MSVKRKNTRNIPIRAGGKNEIFSVALFDSTSAVLVAERLVKEAGISHSIIPVPRHLSSDCGVCLRFFRADQTRIDELLAGRIEDYQLVTL